MIKANNGEVFRKYVLYEIICNAWKESGLSEQMINDRISFYDTYAFKIKSVEWMKTVGGYPLTYKVIYEYGKTKRDDLHAVFTEDDYQKLESVALSKLRISKIEKLFKD